jgi:hypothetical protein
MPLHSEEVLVTEVVTQLHLLTRPIYQYAIGTFNACSWGPTHQSLTDTGGSYNIEGAGFPHHTPRPSRLHFPPKSPA